MRTDDLQYSIFFYFIIRMVSNIKSSLFRGTVYYILMCARITSSFRDILKAREQYSDSTSVCCNLIAAVFTVYYITPRYSKNKFNKHNT